MAVCCIGGVCVPYTAILPLIALIAKWIVTKLAPLGIVPSSICKALGIDENTGKDKVSSSSCCNKNKVLLEGKVTEIETSEAWEESLQKTKVVVAKFTASWCKPCKAIHPYYKDMAARYDDMMFVEIDVDEVDELAQKYSVKMMPTFIVVKNKEEVGRMSGKDEAKLERLVSQHSF
mmetsp:Transcript_14302/g.22040  ORF Transcript_14302/g.22040 Transcript_14302/m.22040 type:complete len:176 (-) Transcript_14302:138-665(-)|eukprot:CAMPEP_0196810870 /NCGR_PEP_ID=MMETSP1362-20130617/14897_1 /TAXON_ID=163516 /ORGANISM="Leptocylindrus danicus, Strain CCMP1856" /LENGTH=175 /DNA_ID=CAMNT_0042186049 /DNA_START=48 /DNA_END=575 /DNA_ORIENTATION=+